MSTPALDTSRDRVLRTAVDGGIVLAHATGARMVAAWTLDPAPRDPIGHLELAHAQARRHAPRKTLRRVLDHALDHLNQIDQWLAWRRDGVVPTPTDGWVPSTVTLPDDRLPLAPAALDAWLWRIDQAARLVVQRAGGLGSAELDWLPPDGGWPLRRVLHHLARSERLYAAALDEALPEEDPSRRYQEACRRLGEVERAAASRGADASIVYAGLYGVLTTPREVVGLVLAIEGELLAGAR